LFYLRKNKIKLVLIGKFLDISEVLINGIPYSHIHGRLYYEFNE